MGGLYQFRAVAKRNEVRAKRNVRLNAASAAPRSLLVSLHYALTVAMKRDLDGQATMVASGTGGRHEEREPAVERAVRPRS